MTKDQRIKRLKMSLRDCYMLARRESIKATRKGLSDEPWQHIMRFCKSNDTEGDICHESILRAEELKQ